MTGPVDILVKKDDLNVIEARPAARPPLKDGEVRVKIDAFSFTANNVTYAVFGDTMNYWGFFPAPEGWGRVPVWGFGDIVESRCEGAPVGKRVYGYFPMSSELVVTPGKVSPAGFTDAAPHRQELHGIYNTYMFADADPLYKAEDENLIMLFRPLFTTSYLIDAYLGDENFFGADAVILSSASSKTSLGLAYCLSRREQRPRIIGLTSGKNANFVSGTGFYDEAVAYDALETLDADAKAVFVDMAGNGEVMARLHQHYDDRLAASIMVGGAHWDKPRSAKELPGPAPVFFFAPDHAAARIKTQGPEGFQAGLAARWSDFLGTAQNWSSIVKDSGPDAALAVYKAHLNGTAAPDKGCILSL